jgi:zinc and cadmium transporter
MTPQRNSLLIRQLSQAHQSSVTPMLPSNSMPRGDFLAACLLAILIVCSGAAAAQAHRHAHDHDHDHDHAHGHDHSHGHTHAAEETATEAAAEPQANLWPLLGLYSVLIAAASLFGGWLPGHIQLSHLRFQLVLSTIGGLILGIGVFHLMVHAQYELGQADLVAKWMMAGMLLMFFLLRTFHVHHHQPELEEHTAPTPAIDSSSPADDGLPQHAHADHSHCHHDHAPRSGLTWMGIFFGLAIHTLLDGLALGATMQAESLHGAGTVVGVGIMLAVALHKPLDSLSITTLMINAEKPARLRWLVNVIYASLCPIGAAAFLLGVGTLDEGAHLVVGCSLAFSAGVFICIALADILPEMEFHSHNRVRLSVALLLGIALAWLIQFLEPAHLHH